MDSPDVGSSKQDPLKTEVAAEISKIIETDKKAFNEWAADPQSRGRLDIPEPALRYILIPSRVFELVDDPNNIRLVTVASYPNEVNKLVVEHKTLPVSNKDALKKYSEEKEKFLKTERAKMGNPSIFFPPKTGGPAFPSDVDRYHQTYLRLVEAEAFGLDDYYINRVNLRIPETNPEVIRVADYRIREELRKQGIGSSFYTRLRECAKELGFRFLTGNNWENNITYFRDKLGRATLDQVKPEKRSDFSIITTGLEEHTIDFLYPEDKNIYLQQS